jgi:hypothetical protein
MSSTPNTAEIFMAFVDAHAGREAAYGAWFAGRHLEDMLRLPGVHSAHAYLLDAKTEPAPPACFSSLYELSNGPQVLGEIARRKGTPDMPLSTDQASMTWRLFDTLGAFGGEAIPKGKALLMVLIGIPRAEVDAAAMLAHAEVLVGKGALYVRALRISSFQPKRGSDYGGALLCAFEEKDGGAAALRAEIERVCGSLLLRFVLARPPEQPSEAQILEYERARCDAMIAGDRQALQALLHDDLIFGHSNGGIDGKVGYLEKLAGGAIFYHAIDWIEPKVVCHRGVALMSGVMQTRVTVSGVERELRGRVLSTWIWSEGAWRLLGYQPTPVKT